MSVRMFATDLDGTLIPLPEMAEKERLVAQINERLDQSKLPTVYVTGRHLSLALEGIADAGLQRPDYFITDVGTQVFSRDGGEWKLVEEYANALSQQWSGEERRILLTIASSFIELELQEHEKQSRYKLSFYGKPTFLRDKNGAVDRFRQTLDQSRIPYQLICSLNPENTLALVDLLPPAASKFSALSVVADTCGITIDEILYFGDSGNDLAVFISGIPSVLVGNTTAEVKDEVRRYAEQNTEAQIYFAESSATAGVLEGIDYFAELWPSSE